MNISPTRRFRRAVGSLDNDSDDDPEIDVSAVSTSSGMNITHCAFPSKRQKMNPVNEQVAEADDDQKPGDAKITEAKERNQVRFSWYLEVAE